MYGLVPYPAAVLSSGAFLQSAPPSTSNCRERVRAAAERRPGSAVGAGSLGMTTWSSG